MDNIIDEYIELTIKHGDAILQGNSKLANKIYSSISTIVEKIRISDNETKQRFYDLLEFENESVKLWTAATLFATFPEKARNVLKKVEMSPTILGLSAKTIMDMIDKKLVEAKTWK